MVHPSSWSLRAATLCAAPLCLAAMATACGGTNPFQQLGPTAPAVPPTSITETFTGTLTVNGAATYPFVVGQAGNATAVLTALVPDDARVGMSLGTWNGVTCQIILANDNATQNSLVVGEARSAGNFCVRIHDVGKLTAPADYLLTVTHF